MGYRQDMGFYRFCLEPLLPKRKIPFTEKAHQEIVFPPNRYREFTSPRKTKSSRGQKIKFRYTEGNFLGPKQREQKKAQDVPGR